MPSFSYVALKCLLCQNFCRKLIKKGSSKKFPIWKWEPILGYISKRNEKNMFPAVNG